MKKAFLMSVVASSITVGMQKNENDAAALHKLREMYADIAKNQFKPTTKVFLTNNPDAPESKILARYIGEVVKAAIAYRDKNLPLYTIGNECKAALQYTPVDPTSFDYILTGREPKEGMLSCAIICNDKWKVELKKIEDKITAQNN